MRSFKPHPTYFDFSCGFGVLFNFVNAPCLTFHMSQISANLQFEHEKRSNGKQLVKEQMKERVAPNISGS